jgi:hypothetical protein
MALTVCTVSGFLYDPEGNTLNSTEVTFRQSEWLAGTDGIVEPRTVTTTTSGAGLISLDLTPGIYWCYTSTQLKNFSISVPDAASADIEVIADFSGNSKKAEFIDGVEAAPSIKFASDTDTGLYLSAANQIGFTTGGTKRAHVDSTEFQIDVPVTGSALQSSATDVTAGKLLAVGAFGIGTGAETYTGSIDLITLATGPYWVAASATGAKPGGHTFGLLIVSKRENASDRVFQTFISDGNSVYTRVAVAGTWTVWSKVFHQGSILGAVSETSGVPTGAVINRGSNANGEYTRFADGTQICTNDNAAITTNPATFVGTVTSIDGDKLRLGYWF